ncbi:MAG: cobalamin-dependent protein [Candidatus Peribacteraceae bacterium]|nr:cobalamin-dependent protein [Candidatus Peribacteraceae bacterium]
MKLVLTFPPPAPEYRTIQTGHEDTLPNPPPTAHAVLAAYLRERIENLNILTVPDSKSVGDGKTAYRSIEEVTALCLDADVLGITCWFHNMPTALELAQRVKALNDRVRVVLGGPNVSSRRMARLVLRTVPQVDAVVRRDGEEALHQLLLGMPPRDIPGVASRQGGTEVTNDCAPVNLASIPLWDFRDAMDWKELLNPYDARSQSYVRSNTATAVPRIGMFTMRGCLKAAEGVHGGRRGSCRYCTSSETSLRFDNPDHFWQQNAHLYRTHGIQDTLIADDILPISPAYMATLHQARERYRDVLSSRHQSRAYAYTTTFEIPEAEQVLADSIGCGVTNYFFGTETFDPVASVKNNKDIFHEEQVTRLLTFLRGRMDSTLALLLGIPGHTKKSIQRDVDAYCRLLDRFGSDRIGEGNLTRVDVSAGAPLVGTPWYEDLRHDPRVCEDYERQTGRSLLTDVAPNYSVLLGIALKRSSDLTLDDIRQAEDTVSRRCEKRLKKGLWGGFLYTREQE